ncbi:hypothetical protein SLS60_010829 [Paraconiothyrium brasiliense]|uniref:Uncharacterized protein n=1 Tax=Paraconiothyrium brasiliense TaxID=300254 RepID=A0ABR3QM46_9PLEO
MAQVETLTILQDVLTKNQPQPVLESELQAFHDFIVSQPDGVETLRLLGRNLPDSTVSIKAMSNDAGAFKSKTSGKGSLLNLWVYQRLTVDAYGKSFTANLGGFSPGFPVGALL